MSFQPIRVKFAVVRSDSGAWGADPDEGDRGIPVLRSTEIGLDGIIIPEQPAIRLLSRYEYERSKTLQGDVLVVKSSGSDAHLGKAGWVGAECAGMSYSNFIQRLRFSEAFDARFAWYFLNSDAMKDQIRLLSSTSTGLQNLSASLIGEAEIPAPPVCEQRRIADFLDSETARIDRVVERIDQSDEAFAAHRKSTLMTAFAGATTTIRLGYRLLLATSGPRGWSEYVGSDGRPFFRSANLQRDSISPKLESLAMVAPPESAEAEAARSRVRAGDVLVGLTGANTGWVSLAEEPIEGACVSQHVCLVRPDQFINGRWLAYALSSPQVQELLLGSQYGGTKTQLGLSDLRDLRLPVPDIADQLSIVKSLDYELGMVRDQRDLRARQRTLLAERRQALITAAVTGQIGVTTARGFDLSGGAA